MLQFAGAKDYDFEILHAVEAVNERQKLRLLDKLKAHFGSLKGKRIAVWGLAFKPRTDDMREAPAVPLIEACSRPAPTVHAYDPEAMKVARGDLRQQSITYADSSYAALTGADALVDRDRVERVPRAGLRAHEEADARRRSSSTAATSTTPTRFAPRGSPTSRWGDRERESS